VAAAPPVPTNGLRSIADAHQDRDLTMKDVDMCCLPVGPYQSEEQLVEAVQAWAGNSATNGGAFAIPPKKESLTISKNRGPRRLLWCDKSGQSRTTKTDGSRPRQLTKKCRLYARHLKRRPTTKPKAKPRLVKTHTSTLLYELLSIDLIVQCIVHMLYVYQICTGINFILNYACHALIVYAQTVI
jgi:hypothetical protein